MDCTTSRRSAFWKFRLNSPGSKLETDSLLAFPGASEPRYMTAPVAEAVWLPSEPRAVSLASRADRSASKMERNTDPVKPESDPLDAHAVADTTSTRQSAKRPPLLRGDIEPSPPRLRPLARRSPR